MNIEHRELTKTSVDVDVDVCVVQMSSILPVTTASDSMEALLRTFDAPTAMLVNHKEGPTVMRRQRYIIIAVTIAEYVDLNVLMSPHES
jgi:hypothetical protein